MSMTSRARTTHLRTFVRSCGEIVPEVAAEREACGWQRQPVKRGETWKLNKADLCEERLELVAPGAAPGYDELLRTSIQALDPAIDGHGILVFFGPGLQQSPPGKLQELVVSSAWMHEEVVPLLLVGLRAVVQASWQRPEVPAPSHLIVLFQTSMYARSGLSGSSARPTNGTKPHSQNPITLPTWPYQLKTCCPAATAPGTAR
ncbi:hypothetical protein DFJ74DRAFT_647771 [Hyaloraphidium curvatum]|nr:hypothetical protein DFJ74DRAFT_647771 [Hyaloraphidium curvatum]